MWATVDAVVVVIVVIALFFGLPKIIVSAIFLLAIFAPIVVTIRYLMEARLRGFSLLEVLRVAYRYLE
jgi:hypothetical protein